MASLLDHVFVTDDVLAFAVQEQALSILEDFKRAASEAPEMFDYVTMRARIGAPLSDPGETLDAFEIGRREGRRELALELLALVKVARMPALELDELIAKRREA